MVHLEKNLDVSKVGNYTWLIRDIFIEEDGVLIIVLELCNCVSSWDVTWCYFNQMNGEMFSA